MHPGFRRAHSKGVCVSGSFRASGDAAALSSARVFAQQETPVLGRLSIGGGSPQAPEAKARVRSLALLLRTDDGQEWRTAMNSFPFFVVATPEGFQAQALAALPELGDVARDANKAVLPIVVRPVAEALRRMEHALHALHERDGVLDLHKALDANQPRTELLPGEPRPRRPAGPGHGRRRAKRMCTDAGKVLPGPDRAEDRNLVLPRSLVGGEECRG